MPHKLFLSPWSIDYSKTYKFGEKHANKLIASSDVYVSKRVTMVTSNNSPWVETTNFTHWPGEIRSVNVLPMKNPSPQF